ncbi:hydroxyacylglutathione hydrolase [Paremcibacter congregatus]|uniref:Hydroxyacylglutathione hydrolase n=1 Tax=Paremcibacter congregatus TaxID=2043170 RepID=A0A2G4YRC9_9PROT|nr:hydroxyacylglutathione hydrolase [Paremcibacter congregatus]PHZ84881.1 hydroxyacylglutathione hydrolase [Paremcibacter congregatus]QDE26145.1 hydroxyacylglutathione hydrolase [Paremcibacter congregatus]
MLVIQIYADNPLRNFNYLIACPSSREALVVDPLDVTRCLAAAKQHGLKITKILNTHEHWDHIDGNEEMRRHTGARLYAHNGAMGVIDHVDVGLYAGDTIAVGQSIKLKVLDTPGHTRSHVCLLANSAVPGLFCGDTLFNAGAGNCHNGGNVDDLYDTFSQQLAKLPDNTKIYPGHDYILTNLKFTLDREPGNRAAEDMLNMLLDHDPHNAYITTMAEERRINSFFRLDSPVIIDKLKSEDPDFSAAPSPRDVFTALRARRNTW